MKTYVLGGHDKEEVEICWQQSCKPVEELTGNLGYASKGTMWGQVVQGLEVGESVAEI
jgi:hypothetical protein